MPVSWRSKAQRNVTLSSLEADLLALFKAMNDIMFVTQLLGSTANSVKLPVTVNVDNVNAFFIANNVTTMSWTKHADIRCKYINEYVENGIMKIAYLKSAENFLTKNLIGELHAKHIEKMIGEKPC